MKNLPDVAAGTSYITSTVSGSYWLLQLLDKVSPSQWAAIGVLASIVFGLLTYLTNLYFKIKDDRRKAQTMSNKAKSAPQCWRFWQPVHRRGAVRSVYQRKRR